MRREAALTSEIHPPEIDRVAEHDTILHLVMASISLPEVYNKINKPELVRALLCVFVIM